MSTILIKKLKQPKANSGKTLVTGESVTVKGVKILNTNKHSVSVSTYERGANYPEKKKKASTK